MSPEGSGPGPPGATAMADWMPIAAAADCPPGTVLERVVGDRIVALANVAGAWHAIDGLCPHQGGPLGKGRLCGTVVTCPWHGWQFDLTSGRHGISPTVRQSRFEVREEDGAVLILVADGSPATVGGVAEEPTA